MDTAIMVHNGSVTDRKGYRWLYDVQCGGGWLVQGIEEADALRLVTCWTEHDTLKARSKVLDEMTLLQVDLETALTALILNTPSGNYRNLLTTLNIKFLDVLRRAKELNNG